MNRPWMPLYIADYMRDTSNLRALESGAYLHLIMAYWISGGLPNDDRQLATIAKLTDGQWKACKPTLAKYFGHDFQSHKRIDAELSKVADISNKRRAAVKQRYNKQPTNVPTNECTLHTTHNTKKEEERKQEARASRGAPLPSDWIPSESDFEKGRKLGLTNSQMWECLDEMREWAGANSNRSVGRKANWSLAFQAWMRRKSKEKSNGQTGNVIAAADRLIERIAEFDKAPDQPELRGGTGQNPVRMLSQGGRERS
jgi:uncharacterized protein YdaU (DUF1376 family)